MISPLNLAFTSWLLVSISVRQLSAHSDAGIRLDYGKSSLSYDDTNSQPPRPKHSFPFADERGPYYGSDGTFHDDSVASSTTPPPTSALPVSGMGWRDGWTPIIRAQTPSREHDRYAETQFRHGVDGVKRERAGSPRQSRTSYQKHVKPKQLRQFQRYNSALQSNLNSARLSPLSDERYPTFQYPQNKLNSAQRSPSPDELHSTFRYPLGKLDSARLNPPIDELGSTFQYPQKKKEAVTLNENDIMRMHYGPPTGGHHYSQVSEKDQDRLVRTPSLGRIKQRSYEVEEIGEDEVAAPPAQNIHSVIDTSTAPTFDGQVADLTKRQTSTDAWLLDEASSENTIQTYKFGYDDRIVKKPLQGSTETPSLGSLALLDHYDDFERSDNKADFTGYLSNRKHASQNVTGFVNLAATSISNPREEESLDSLELSPKIIETSSTSLAPTKSGRLSDKPIIIMELQTTTLTPEYYRQLFDSFSSGHYRQEETSKPAFNKKSPLRGKKKWPSMISTTETTAASPAASAASSTEKSEDTKTRITQQSPVRQNETEKSDSIFFSIPSHQLVDLIPKTLRLNFIAVKRVLIDCYTPNDRNKNKSSSVNCLKKITFDILDKAIESDVVKLTDVVSLVKDNKTTDGQQQGRSATSQGTEEAQWLPSIVKRIQKLFSTHALKVKLMNSPEPESYQVEGRRRYRHTFRRIFPVVASIYMTVTSVLIPLVFQFMAVMAGKSFMVGKIALLFALFTSFNKFLSLGIENILPWYYQTNHASHSQPSPPPPPPVLPVPYPVPFHHPYDHQKKDNRKKDTNVYDYSYTTKRVPINYSYYTLE